MGEEVKMARFTEAFRILDQCLSERMEAFNNPALALALTDRSKLVRLSAMGYANLDAKIPAAPRSPLCDWLDRKSFTAIASLQASEAGLA
jgi:CubicO group peptidase (beta-lactamase class C family)